MSAEVEHRPAAPPRLVEDVVCTVCGCLCDDIELTIEGNRIIEARNACPIGAARFLGFRSDPGLSCLVDGIPASFEAAVERAANILASARYPLIFGLADTVSEAQAAAVALAARIGACVDSGGTEGEASVMAALASVGEVTCTLGEVRNRADLIVVWRADPLETHPRLFSRYALEPAGTFVPRGRSDRYCAIVDVRESGSVQEAADQFIAIEDDGEFEALWVLRALARGIEVDPVAVESATGVPLAIWQDLMERMRAARYGVLFHGTDQSGDRRRRWIPRAIHSLVRELNTRTRFVALPLGGAGNAVGARNVLTWRTGYPFAVDLARGKPRHGPGEFNAEGVLRTARADAVLIVAGDPTPGLCPEAREHLGRIPRVVLGSERPVATGEPAVVIPTAAFGISTPGTAYRMDGVPLPLRSVIASSLPTDEVVLRAIDRGVRSLSRHDGRARAEGH